MTIFVSYAHVNSDIVQRIGAELVPKILNPRNVLSERIV